MCPGGDDWKDTIYPCVPGHEIIGKITYAGSAVTKFKVGDTIGVGCMTDSFKSCSACKEGEEQFCEHPHGPTMTYNGGADKKNDTVVYSGFVEIARGTALVFISKEQEKDLGKMAASFFTAVFPGNIAQHTRERCALGLDTNNKRLARLFFQPVLVYWALKSTRNVS